MQAGAPFFLARLRPSVRRVLRGGLRNRGDVPRERHVSRDFLDDDMASLTKALEAARSERIGDPEAVDAFLLKRFSRSQTQAIKAAHLQDEQRPIETLWDCATGITAYARDIQFQDTRVALEREAGKIIDLVS